MLELQRNGADWHKDQTALPEKDLGPRVEAACRRGGPFCKGSHDTDPRFSGSMSLIHIPTLKPEPLPLILPTVSRVSFHTALRTGCLQEQQFSATSTCGGLRGLSKCIANSVYLLVDTME